jgi:hypothetical protein
MSGYCPETVHLQAYKALQFESMKKHNYFSKSEKKKTGERFLLYLLIFWFLSISFIPKSTPIFTCCTQMIFRTAWEVSTQTVQVSLPC